MWRHGGPQQGGAGCTTEVSVATDGQSVWMRRCRHGALEPPCRACVGAWSDVAYHRDLRRADEVMWRIMRPMCTISCTWSCYRILECVRKLKTCQKLGCAFRFLHPRSTWPLWSTALRQIGSHRPGLWRVARTPSVQKTSGSSASCPSVQPMQRTAPLPLVF